MPQFFFTERYAQSYGDAWARFVRVLDGEAAPDSTGIDGQQAPRLAEAAYVALQTGRRVEL